jgi:hypothetical protein
MGIDGDLVYPPRMGPMNQASKHRTHGGGQRRGACRFRNAIFQSLLF